MKLLQTKGYQFFNIVLSGLLALLGISGCTKDSPDEYGTPRATFIVKGTITSAETNEPVENIKVVMVPEISYTNDSSFTDASGFYEVKDDNGFPDDSEYLIKIQDIDGDAYGAFEDVDTTLVFEDPDVEGGNDGWYDGMTSKEFNIKLTPKK